MRDRSPIRRRRRIRSYASRITHYELRIVPPTPLTARISMKRQAILAIAGAAVLAACDGFKEAMSAHQDVVARAGGQELSVTRLSELMGNSKIPLQKDVARAVADLWVSYQLLGHAAANGDSLNDQKIV